MRKIFGVIFLSITCFVSRAETGCKTLSASATSYWYTYSGSYNGAPVYDTNGASIYFSSTFCVAPTGNQCFVKIYTLGQCDAGCDPTGPGPWYKPGNEFAFSLVECPLDTDSWFLMAVSAICAFFLIKKGASL